MQLCAIGMSINPRRSSCRETSREIWLGHGHAAGWMQWVGSLKEGRYLLWSPSVLVKRGFILRGTRYHAEVTAVSTTYPQ